MESKIFRAHPLMIFLNLRHFFILAIIPILRGIITALSGDLSSWTEGLWMDIIILATMFAFAVARWFSAMYSFNHSGLSQKNGLFFSKRTHLPWNNISVLKVSSPVYARLFSACFLRCDSIGGSYRNTDINLIVSKKHSEEIENYYDKIQNTSLEYMEVRPSLASVLSFAVISTNSFVGIFYLATFISQSGKIIGREFSEILVGTFESFARTLSLHIPPAAAALTYLLIVTWLIGVLFTIFRYHKFYVWRKENTLLLSGGLFSKQKYLVDTRQINYISNRQNIITFFLGTYSMFISAVGVGKEKTDITCVLPMKREENMGEDIRRLFPGLTLSPITLTPVNWGFMSYIVEPLLSCFGIIIVSIVGIYIVPSWNSFIRFVSLMSLIPGFGFLIMRFVEYRHCGIGKNTVSITMRYSTGFTLHTQVIPLDRIVKIQLKQGFFQKFGDNCTVLIYTQSETRKRHRCRNVSLTKAAKFLGVDLLNNEISKKNPFSVIVKAEK